MIKAVLDTNQFVSGLIMKKGASREILQAWQESAFLMVTSRDILKEVHKVLQYPKISKKYGLTEEDISSLFNLVTHEAVVLSATPKLDIVKDDPEDNKILSCAIEARADYIVTGDKDLRVLGMFKDITIVDAREFMNILKQG